MEYLYEYIVFLENFLWKLFYVCWCVMFREIMANAMHAIEVSSEKQTLLVIISQ